MLSQWRKTFIDDVASAVIDGLKDAEAESVDEGRPPEVTAASWGSLLLVGSVEFLALVSSAVFALLLSLWGSAKLSHSIAQRQFDEAYPEAMNALEDVRTASDQALPAAKETALEAVAKHASAHDGLRWWGEIGLELEPWVLLSALVAGLLLLIKVGVAHHGTATSHLTPCCSNN